MKNYRIFLALLVAGLAPLLMESSCSNGNPMGNGMYGSGPVPTSTPGPAAAVTVTAVFSGNYQYSPASFTIMHGQAVLWTTANIHPLNIDDGSGTCLVSGTTSFPYTYTFMTAGTYHFHCGVHSTCGNGSCPNPTTCSGMVGTITVN